MLVQLATAGALLSSALGPVARPAVVAAHIAGGALLVGGALRRSVGGARRLPRRALFGPLLVALTAALVLLLGARREHALVVALHAFVAGGAGLWLVGHGRRWLAVAGALSLAALSFVTTSAVPRPVEISPPTGPFDPDRGGGYLDSAGLSADDAVRFVDVSRCTPCHESVVEAHDRSAHRHASLSNPYYQRALRSLVSQKGPRAAELCAGCHDHGLVANGLFERALDEGPGVLDGAPAGVDIGVPCLSCHGASGVRSLRGNGALHLALPDDPVVTADGPALALARALTRVDPRAHRRVMKDGATGSSLRCGTCHQIALHEGIGGIPHLRSQSERDDHRQSVFFAGSGASGRLPTDAPARRCVDCHFATERGGHASLQANSALPAARGDVASLDVVRRALEGAEGEPPPWSLSWLLVEDERVQVSDGVVEAAPGEELELHALLTNEGVGHQFPGGTKDLHRVWLFVEVTDARGRVLLRHPEDPGDGDMPDDAHGLGARMIDEEGKDVLEHLTERMHTPLWEHAMLPGHGHIARYRFAVPAGAEGPLKVRARLYQRKLARVFEDNATRGEAPYEIPTYLLADTDAPRFALAPPLRLARYADAAGAVWDDERAALALVEAQRIAPADLEVKLARARFLEDRRHQREDAAALLEGIADPRARFLRAKALVDGGRCDEGLRILDELVRAFPHDVEVWRARALGLRRVGEQRESYEAALEVIARQPDDFEALRFLMAVAGELGEKEAVQRFRKGAERVRVAREATRAALERQKRDAVANQEADRVHVHVLEAVGPVGVLTASREP